MSFKHDKTSEIIEKCIATIDENAPINISFVTQPISKAFVDRIKALEKVYSQSKFYQFLIRKGVYPTLLFSAVSGGIGYGALRTYNRSTKLVLNLLGVVYPTYCCWHLVKGQLNNGQEEELKSWLTYWMIFGTFQVLDHWMASDFFMFSRKKYSLYKLVILYWAQSPHSKGALLLYRHVIQKPIMKATDQEEEYTLIKKEQHTQNYRILDGYNPTILTSSINANPAEDHNNSRNNHVGNSSASSSSSSSDDDSVRLQYHTVVEDRQNMNDTLSTAKEAFPPLLMNPTEAAW